MEMLYKAEAVNAFLQTVHTEMFSFNDMVTLLSLQCHNKRNYVAVRLQSELNMMESAILHPKQPQKII